MVRETDAPGDWEEHEAYCDYVQATLTWLEEGCCQTGEEAGSPACDDLQTDLELADTQRCQ
jgi:hypothetical protein